MGGAGHRLFVGSFPALEERFLEELAALRAGDPLRPVEVLAGSNLLGVGLRRRAAERLGAVANVRHVTFLDLARSLVVAPDPRPPLPPLGAALLALRALRETEAAEAFGELRGRLAFAEAVLATADDLRDAGLPPGALPRLLPRAGASAERRARLSALGETVAALEALRGAFSDPSALLESAAETLVSPSDEPLLVYGLYDLGGTRERLLAHLALARRIVAFVPDDGETEPAGTRARASLFRTLLGTSPERLRWRGTRPEPEVVLAPSEAAEAREVVRALLASVEAGVPLHRTAVLLRRPEAQEAAIALELDRRGLPYFRPAAPAGSRSPVARAAALVLSLAASGFLARDLRELLDHLETLGLLDRLGLSRAEPVRVGRAVAALRFRRGRDDLARRLAAPPREAREDDLAALALLLDVVGPHLPPTTPAPWREWGERLGAAFEALLGGGAEAERARDAGAALGALEAVEPRGSVTASEALALLPRAFDLGPVPHGRFERDGTNLLSCVSARGILFDAVIVPGLSEATFPAPPRPDPLLPDDERSALAAAARVPVPVRGGERHAREERFLFRLSCESARSRLVLLAPRREDGDRPLLVSPLLLSALSERAGEPVTDETLSSEEGAAAAGARWLPLGGLTREGPALDRQEAQRRRLRAGIAPAADAPLRRALARAAARRSPRFTEHEGRLGRPPLASPLASPLSASRLEAFAACAYRSFLRQLLGLEALERPEAVFAPDPRALGQLVHAALRELALDAIAREVPLGEVSPARVGPAARAAAARFFTEVAGGAPEALVEAAAARIAAATAAVLSRERERADRLPVRFAERPFGRRGEVLAGSGDPRVALRGVLDRLDSDGERALVVDYKTSEPKPFGKRNRRGLRVAGGERSQLALYALAARGLVNGPVATEYLFVDGSARLDPEAVPVGFSAGTTAEAVEALGRVLELAAGAIGRGDLLPKTTSSGNGAPHCDACDLAPVCGPGHDRLFTRKRDAERQSDPDHPLFLLEAVP